MRRYADATLRFHINEVAPLRPRYEVADVLEPLHEAAFESFDTEHFVLTVDANTKVVFHPADVRADIEVDGVVVASLNHRKLFYFEYLRCVNTV